MSQFRVVRSLHMSCATAKKDTSTYRHFRDKKKKGEQIRLRELVKEAELDVIARSASASTLPMAVGGKKRDKKK